MARLTGWKRLLAEPEWCRGDGRFPLPAYSEFLPPPWVALKPYAGPDPHARDPKDNWGWHVSEYEQAHELRPGLQAIARAALAELMRLGRGQPAPQVSRRKLADNPYWPAGLQAEARAGKLAHERYVLLLSLALSRTQDDKGRVPWSLFGSSEQGPALPFWKGFYTAPGRPLPAEQGLALFRRLLAEVYRVPEPLARDPARAGLRVLPAGEDEQFPFWGREPFPPWCEDLLWDGRGGVRRVKFLLTFRPFARLPAGVQQAYVAGELHLWPFPGSLLFWGASRYRELRRQLPLAMQVPLLHLLPRCRAPGGLRVPQAGWLHEHGPGLTDEEAHTPSRPEFQRTHRWQAIARDLDETALLEGADRVARVLFSTAPEDLGLYDKPMARNVQLWDTDYRLLLDGPRAGRAEIRQAVRAVEHGGQFGYRFTYPAMRVGRWEVYWQRPLAAVPSEDPAQPKVLHEGPAGYLTAYRADAPDPAEPVELWPRLLDRPAERAAVELFAGETHPRRHASALNVRSLLDYHALLGGGPLPLPLARALIEAPKNQTLRDWLASLPEKSDDPEGARKLTAELERRLAPPGEPEAPDEGLTFAATARRNFEVAYWKTIALLAHGKYRNKDNADCVQDEPTRAALRHHHRDLEALGEYLMRRHARAIRRAGLKGKAWVGEHAFHWRTDFEFPWSGGWSRNQDGRGYERNIVVRIPGRDASRAVIMADHYDTAYMADRYDPKYGGTGARVAAAGADDNHSATAALLLAAPILLELSKAGRLGCDVWLVHLTGEEFPSDCLGARHLCRALVEGNLRVREFRGGERDLSGVRVKGVYVSDMIAHNNDRERSVFQIAPGEGAASAWLALQAHRANEAWNALARARNGRRPRRGRGRAKRVRRGQRVPPLAEHALLRGEVRPEWDPRSTLYNTDGQIFSDVGVPVVLFMEDYDINRSGYHDSHDTLANIDLDYGAALAAIVIESVARAAAEPGPGGQEVTS
jgi:hypothetical protein